MAVAWMDAARYGDSSVMHADGHRDMWPWRDWLIEAYNANQPFDQFTVEQLAGDLLPEATPAQRVASGFNRNHATSDEGGAIPEELRVEYVVDRVKTTANVWLALSLECGQCHDHKYDPISQREYYQFFAYFNRTTDPGIQTRNGNQAPVMRLSSEAQEKELTQVRKQIAGLKERRATTSPPRSKRNEWARRVGQGERQPSPEWHDWERLGPFSVSGPKEAFEKDHGPEKEKSKKGRRDYGGKRWERVEWRMKEVSLPPLELASDQAIYFGRVLEADRELKGTLRLGAGLGVKIWLNGKSLHARQVGGDTGKDPDGVEITVKPGRHWLLIKLVGNGEERAPFPFQWVSPPYPEEILAVVARPPVEWSVQKGDRLTDYYSKNIWPEGLKWDRQLAVAVEREKAILGAAPTSMVMEDQRENPRMTYILNRGQYDRPIKDQPVQPGVPSVLPSLPEDVPNNRLGLARWLTLPDHPLTSRVAVNRFWAMLFGQGIVRTVGDFGNQGEWPSHLDLLNWLARDFVVSGWDVKRALKQMVLSSTYGQSSRWRDELLERDLENRLLARASRFRLQGEFIRDHALAASGLLVEELGGPSVKPYQPPNIWNEVSLNKGLRYQRDSGAKLYRRSLYTYWKRSAPMPNMILFDAPSREKCALSRPRTNTPLQALVTLNDPQFVEAARVLAQRLLDREESFDERLDRAFRLVIGRAPSRAERRLLGNWLERESKRHFEDGEEAEALFKVGEFPESERMEPGELARWTLVAQLIFNLDETLTRN